MAGIRSRFPAMVENAVTTVGGDDDVPGNLFASICINHLAVN